MHEYKCDKCGGPAYVDPDEPRICVRCQKELEEQDKPEKQEKRTA